VEGGGGKVPDGTLGTLGTLGVVVGMLGGAGTDGGVGCNEGGSGGKVVGTVVPGRVPVGGAGGAGVMGIVVVVVGGAGVVVSGKVVVVVVTGLVEEGALAPAAPGIISVCPIMILSLVRLFAS
jgi:hypothetical protein